MKRRRLTRVVSLTAAVLAGGAIAYFAANRRPPETSFEGHSAYYWLRQMSLGQQDRVLEAFHQMGTNAVPVLEAALEAGDGPYARVYRRIYFSRLLAAIQRYLPEPPDDPSTLRKAAMVVLQNSPDSPIFPILFPLLKEPDSGLRLEVLPIVYSRIAPSDAGQIPFLLLAANDPNAKVRAAALLCLSRIGRSATSAVPPILNLCADTDMDVRMDAAWALWKITRQTNTAVPVLQGILRQNNDAHCLEWVTCYLLNMEKSDRLWITILINSLTNSVASDRVTACASLGRIGPPAAAAIPSLRKTLQDPDEEVRQWAKIALTRIDPEHSAAESQ